MASESSVAGMTLPTHFNLTFKLNAEPSVTMFDAVVNIQRALDASTITSGMNDLARRWLFPEQTDLRERGNRTSMGDEIKWVDEKLNEEQRVSSI